MEKTKTEKIVVYFALAISLLSMAAAMKSCSLSQQAYNIAEKDHISQRKIILGAKFPMTEWGGAMVLSSDNPEFTLQNVCTYFPSLQMSLTDDLVSSTIDLSSIRTVILETIVNNGHSRPNSGFIGSSELPIRITTSYIAKGNIYIDASNYVISYQVYGGSDANGEKSASLNFFDLRLESREYVTESENNIGSESLCGI